MAADLDAEPSFDSGFDFKPINDGLGFHRKANPLDLESGEGDDFSFSNVAGAKGLLSESTAGSSEPGAGKSAKVGKEAAAKVRHNSKSVSELIAALPPAMDLLDERDLGLGGAASTPKYQPSTPIIVKPGAPAAPSLSAPSAGQAAKTAAPKGFLKLPLGREDYKATTAQSAIDENLAKAFPNLGGLAGKRATDLSASAGKAALAAGLMAPLHTPDLTLEKPIALHFGAAVLDALVGVGLGCVLLAISLAITNANLVALLENSQTDTVTIATLGLLFLAGGLLYVLAARSFMGATLGEWSYEVRIGKSQARRRWYYPVQILWRGLLVTASGFILFPLISAIAGRDVLKYLTGVELVSIENNQVGASA